MINVGKIEVFLKNILIVNWRLRVEEMNEFKYQGSFVSVYGGYEVGTERKQAWGK